MVYEALDLERDTHVALKTVLHHDADALARFKREFRALQGIHHPNLVSLGELVAEGGELFFTMELLEGVDLVTFVRGEHRSLETTSSKTIVEAARRIADPTIVDPPRPGADRPKPPPPVVVAPPVPTDRLFDVARLRDAFRQVALGLTALHEAGKVHRDVKPSNVLVSPAGRVVLLDFGLVAESGRADETDLAMAGTPAYMAPEQVTGEGPVGPAADWYAVGVMMYQCLTGRRPFEGASLEVLQAKVERAPARPSSVASGVPRDLDALCMELLSIEKSERPSAATILQRLDAPAPGPDGSGGFSVSQSGSVPFVGRAHELVELTRAFVDVVGGRAVTIALQGESGVGKSCLVKRFVEEVLPMQREDVLVLTGRCYEREAVPYKAFDEIIDTVSRKLARLEEAELLALLPSHVEELALLFPALLRAPLIAQQAKSRNVDPHERRRHGFDAVRELFARLARRQRLVLAIDDLQWTDADSLHLLAEILQPPDAPAMLLLATIRRDADASGGGRARVLASLPGDVRVLDLDRLAPADARELAARLLRRAAPGADAAAIADEAGGHPLFIDELVRHAALTSGEHQAAALRLDDALAARVERLDPGARRVLEIACVLGAPTPQETVAHAAALEMGDFVRAVALLRTANLVRTQGSRVSDGMEPYHDRVREAVVARLDPEVKRLCHDSIASALEVSKAFDPEVLATHWTGAGKPTRAATYTIVAAEQASGALAFDRAARLYERAIVLLADGDPRRDALRRQLGDALANAGHAVRAAEEYERAASGAGTLDAIDLRRRAAAQLLRAGESARGAEATSRVLAAVGMRYPPTTLEAVVTFFWYRLLLWLRGFGYVLRDESELPPEALIRVDVCGSAAETSLYADTLRGTLFHTRHLLLALRLGEPNRIVRGLAQECTYLGASGSKKWARTQRVIALAREVSERAGTAEARATVLGYEGAANCFNFRYSAAIGQIQQAIALYREIPGAIWEVTTLRFFLLAAYHYSSRNLEHRAEQEAALKDALARGDRYATRMLRIGVLNRAWWLAGDPARARHELDEAVREGATSTRGYGLTNLHQLVGYAYVDLYEGNGRAAYARVTEEWPLLRRSFLLLLEPLALEAGTLRARTALGAASAPDCEDRDALVHEAERALRGFKVMDTPTSRWALRSIHVGIAALKRHKDDVTRILGHLASDDAEEAWIAKQSARWVLGAMRGSIEGEAQVRDAKKALELRGIVPDARLLGVLFPGLDVAQTARAGR